MELDKFIGQKVILTTAEWFYGSDGKQYRAIFGTLRKPVAAKEAFGFDVSRNHTNWMVEVGNMIIMGCQVRYVVLCDTPNFGEVEDWCTPATAASEPLRYTRPSTIYNAEI